MFALKDATHVDQDRVLLLFASPCTQALRDAVSGVPGVEGAACSSPYALDLADNRDKMSVAGRQAAIATASIDFGFFELYGVRPIVGRLFSVDHPADDGALAMTWWLEGFAYRVDLAPWTFLLVGGLTVAIALATVFLHALKVARAKPVGALRYE